MTDGCISQRTEGTPQGSPLSPLLSNIILHELDVELTKRGLSFVRYADDCSIYVRSCQGCLPGNVGHYKVFRGRPAIKSKPGEEQN